MNNELIKAKKINSDLAYKLQQNYDKIDYLKQIIQMKDIEINNLKNKKLINYDDIIVVNFMTADLRINCGIKCLLTDTFAEVEEKLYQQYSDFRETNNNFIGNGRLILRFKTISENGIKNGDKIQLINNQ